MATVSEVLAFWFEELTEADWYAGGDALDSTIRARFGAVWGAARRGDLTGWQGNPRGVLAFLIVTDQMSRNMHRQSARAFETDGIAHAAAFRASVQGWDMRIEGPARQFMYTPFMHAETLADQNRSVASYALKLKEGDAEHLLHARAHREVIRKFGRFPARNIALGRTSSVAESEYLALGGYGALIKSLRG